MTSANKQRPWIEAIFVLVFSMLNTTIAVGQENKLLPPSAKLAFREHQAEVAAAEANFAAEVNQARKTFLAKLDKQMKYETAAGNLDNAVAIRDEIRRIESETKPKFQPHYLDANRIQNLRFLDWINNTWENDIRKKIVVRKVADGYQYVSTLDGHSHKLILLPKEDVLKRVLVVSLRIEKGVCGVGFKPRNLAPDGTEVHLDDKQRYDVRLWIEGGVAKCTVNNAPTPILHKPECYGFFELIPSNQAQIVFYDIHCEDNPAK